MQARITACVLGRIASNDTKGNLLHMCYVTMQTRRRDNLICTVERSYHIKILIDRVSCLLYASYTSNYD